MLRSAVSFRAVDRDMKELVPMETHAGPLYLVLATPRRFFGAIIWRHDIYQAEFSQKARLDEEEFG